MGFVFFDTETTGLRHGFDQIVHFAAIRTDNDLNEVDRFEARSRLLPHVVPHPSALLTNGLPIERLTDGACRPTIRWFSLSDKNSYPGLPRFSSAITPSGSMRRCSGTRFSKRFSQHI